MTDGLPDTGSVTDPILSSLIGLTLLCQTSGDPETLMGLHIALQSRCGALGLNHTDVLRRFLGMDAELDFPDFD